jgi:MFS family permease
VAEVENAAQKLAIFYGWWVVVAATAVLCAQGITFYGFGILFPSILEEFQWSRALTSSIFSVHISTNSLFILLMGYLIDRYSPRMIVGFGALLLGTGLIFSSFTREIWHLYLFFGLVVGAGSSTTYVPPITVVTRWFERKRGLALGITVTGIGIGGFLGSPFINWLIQGFGWRVALPSLGVVTGAIVLAAAMVLVGRPEEKDLAPYGAVGPEKDQATESARASENRVRIVSERNQTDHWTLWEALKTRSFWILFIMFFFAEASLLGVMGHLFTHMSESGLANDVVSWAYSVIGVASLVGKVGAGALSDRIGRRMAFVLSFAVKGTAFIFLLPAPNVFLLYLFAVALGLSYGGWTPLFPAILGDFYGLQSMGKIFSILTINFLLGGICGPILTGWIFDRAGSYFFAFAIFSVICYLAAILAFLLGTPRKNAAGTRPYG